VIYHVGNGESLNFFDPSVQILCKSTASKRGWSHRKLSEKKNNRPITSEGDLQIWPESRRVSVGRVNNLLWTGGEFTNEQRRRGKFVKAEQQMSSCVTREVVMDVVQIILPDALSEIFCGRN
jgi:hypothetical protein